MRAMRIDDNQRDIVDALRKLGISVALKHDDILVGYKQRTYWFEVKNGERCFLADGVTFRQGALKPGQDKLRRTWMGHYDVVWDLDMILYTIGYKSGDS